MTVAGLVGRCLRALGARRVFGDPVPGLDHVAVAEPALAAVLADADGRRGPGPGVARQGRRLRLTSRPGTVCAPVAVTDPARLPGQLASFSVGEVHAAAEYDLDLDLDAPAPDGLEPLVLDLGEELFTLSPTLADLPTVVLAGPGVVRAGQVDALVSFAAQAGVGVVNTWGAKGVLPWDSAYHLGTAGLQERDFELAGLGEVELIIATGLDPDESPGSRWELAQSLEVEPASLAALAFDWPPPTRSPGRPRLYTGLAAAVQPGFASEAVPLHPARAVAALGAVADRPGGLVAGEPGAVGLWVARAFATRRPGSVIVPATVCPGIALALAVTAALDGAPAVAVTGAAAPDGVEAELLGVARQLETTLTVVRWDDAPGAAPDAFDRLADALAEGAGVREVTVPVDASRLAELEAVAGPVVAWGGLLT